MQKIAIYEHHRTTIGLYLRNEGMHRQSEKIIKQQYLLQMSLQYGELRPSNG